MTKERSRDIEALDRRTNEFFLAQLTTNRGRRNDGKSGTCTDRLQHKRERIHIRDRAKAKPRSCLQPLQHLSCEAAEHKRDIVEMARPYSARLERPVLSSPDKPHGFLEQWLADEIWMLKLRAHDADINAAGQQAVANDRRKILMQIQFDARIARDARGQDVADEQDSDRRRKGKPHVSDGLSSLGAHLSFQLLRHAEHELRAFKDEKTGFRRLNPAPVPCQ